jgi:carbamoyltransferase
LDVDYLCLAGGVALNCVANGRLDDEGPFKATWIQPAAGDAGGALGAALATWYEYLEKPRTCKPTADLMRGSYLGPKAKQSEIESFLESIEAPFHKLDDADLVSTVADLLTNENVVGWFNGRMEFGPRALGARSIIGDARSPKMQSVMNLKIKYRESFRPFAPAIKAESVAKWFGREQESPYMLKVAKVNDEHRIPLSEDEAALFGIEKLNVPRSSIPAVTHVDYSARIQTVHKETNPRFHALLSAFEERTDCPVLINTSFNVRGEPIVCTAEDAYRCFMRTEMDVLVLENALLFKHEQSTWENDDGWQDEFQLD